MTLPRAHCRLFADVPGKKLTTTCLQKYLAKGGRGGRAQSDAKGCQEKIRCVVNNAAKTGSL